ncbi:MAG: hypothetical protein O2779_04540 [Nanoarchaeota archaeon]|nr:hypothetical protein [Nanoarchaeota archaeon]
MKRILLLMMLVMVPVVMGEILIDTTYEDVFLGDALALKVVLTPDNSYTTIFGATLECSSGSLPYFSKPVSLTEGKSLTIRVPEVQAYLTGDCSIVAALSRLNGEEIERESSNSFSVGSVLELEATLDKDVLQPGDAVTLKGKVTRGSEVVNGISLTITFQETRQEISLSSGTFSETITIGETAQSGKHGVVVNAHDSFGNIAETRLDLIVEAVATEVKHSATSLSASPGDTLSIFVLLLDQAGVLLQKDLTVRLFRERFLRDDVILFSKVVSADSTFDFDFDTTIPPGEYLLESSFENLKDVDFFVVEEVSSFESNFEGKILTLTNTGNVAYENEVSITLVSSEGVFVIKEKLKLDINEQKIIDLSEEAPSGNYEAVITDEPISDEDAESLVQERQDGNSITGMSVALGDGQQELVASAVDVDYGKRGVLQKIGDTTSSFFSPEGFSFKPYLYVILGIGLIFLLQRYLKRKPASKHISPDQIEKQIKHHGVDSADQE